METSGSLQELINQLQEIGAKVSDASITQEELETFQSLASLIHERAIILNYKAKEEQVFGAHEKATAATATQQEQETVEETPEPVAEEVKEIKEEKIQEEQTGILFDFSAPAEEVKSQEPVQQEEEESTAAPEPIAEEDQSDEVVTPEVLPEEPKESQSFTASRITEIKTDDAVYSFYERFSKVTDDSVMGMLGAQKLDSIKGAFGLNDRLQFIQELFAGNADAFNATIETLDQQNSREEAQLKLSEIAAQHQWEPDDILVEDLAKLVRRRYVE